MSNEGLKKVTHNDQNAKLFLEGLFQNRVKYLPITQKQFCNPVYSNSQSNGWLQSGTINSCSSSPGKFTNQLDFQANSMQN